MSPKPIGSKIQEIEELDGMTYRWERPDGGVFRVVLWVVVVIQALLILGIVVVPPMFNQRNPQGAPADIVALAFGVIFVFVFGLGMSFFFLRRSRPASVTLGDDRFRYDPGRQAAISIWWNPWLMMKYSDPTEMWSKFFRRPKPIELLKTELGRVVLDRAGERQRLYFDYGADRVEIGECLREPEREWLASVIHEWQNEEG